MVAFCLRKRLLHFLRSLLCYLFMFENVQTNIKGKALYTLRIKLYLGPFKNSVLSKLLIFDPPPAPPCLFLLVLDKLLHLYPSINMNILLTKVTRSSSNLAKDAKRNKLC